MILRLKNLEATRDSLLEAMVHRAYDQYSTSVRPCDGVFPGNLQQLPVISGNIHVKLASSGVDRFHNQKKKTLVDNAIWREFFNSISY